MLDEAIALAESRVEKAKHRAFAYEYVRDHNGAAAAIRAGYAKKSAKQQAARLLTNDDLAALVAALDAKASALASTDAERVRLELARVGFAKITDAVEWDENGVRLVDSEELRQGALASIAEVIEEETVLATTAEGERVLKRKRRIKMHPKIPALVKLAEMNGQIGRLASRDLGADNELPGVIMVPTPATEDEWVEEHGEVHVDEHGHRVN